MNFVKSTIAKCIVFAVSLVTVTLAFRIPQAQAGPLVLAENGESFIEPMGANWCTHPVKIVARGRWGQPIDPNKPEFRALAQAAIAPVLRLCGLTQVIDLWFQWADHIEPVGRTGAEMNWQWPRFGVPPKLARALQPPPRELVEHRAPKPQVVVVPPPPAPPAEPIIPLRYLIGGIAWSVLVAIAAAGKTAESPATRRISNAALNILLAFVPVIFGARPPSP